MADEVSVHLRAAESGRVSRGWYQLPILTTVPVGTKLAEAVRKTIATFA
jgi:hypothetical protein